jgi:hypothetical protein
LIDNDLKKGFKTLREGYFSITIDRARVKAYNANMSITSVTSKSITFNIGTRSETISSLKENLERHCGPFLYNDLRYIS